MTAWEWLVRWLGRLIDALAGPTGLLWELLVGRHRARHERMSDKPQTDEELAERFDWSGEAPDPGELLRKTFGGPSTEGPFTHTFTPALPRTMTRRETYRHCTDNGWRRRDALLMALLSEDERPEASPPRRPSFTIERSEGT